MPRSFAQISPATQQPLRTRSADAVPCRVARVTGFTVPLRLALASALIAGALLSGAAHAASPADEIAAAQAAIARAERADAEQYDPQGLLRAREALLRAQNAARDGDAQEAAELAEAEADLARARSIEAANAACLAQRRNELRELGARLDMEGQP